MNEHILNNRVLIPRRCIYIITAAISLLSFLVFYIPEGFRFSVDEWVLYLSFFIRSFTSSLLPALGAAAIFISHRETTWQGRIIPAVLLSLPRLIYLLPYNYLRYMAEAYDSIEAVGLMLLRSAIEIIIYAIEIYAYSAIAIFVYKRRATGREDLYARTSIFSIEPNSNFALFAIAFSRFFVDLADEIVYIVNYIIEYAETYRLGEIYFILGKLLFILFSLLLSYVLLVLTVRLFKKRIDQAEADAKEQ